MLINKIRKIFKKKEHKYKPELKSHCGDELFKNKTEEQLDAIRHSLIIK